jgi:Domain of unknown function (DUF4398)
MTPRRPTAPSHTLQRTLASAGLLAVITFGLGACATPPPAPNEQLAVSAAAIQNAATAGAAQFAPAELALARDKMARATQAAAADEPVRAMALAQQAQADANLARAKAEAAKSKKAADAVDEADRALREEMARKTAPNTPRN